MQRKSSVGIGQPSKRQAEILDFIGGFRRKKGYAPSLAEIAEHLGVSVPTVHQHVSYLRQKNLLTTEKGKQRSIQAFNNRKGGVVEIPLMGLIAAGGPIEAIRDPRPIEVPRNMLSADANYYALKVAGICLAVISASNLLFSLLSSIATSFFAAIAASFLIFSISALCFLCSAASTVFSISFVRASESSIPSPHPGQVIVVMAKLVLFVSKLRPPCECAQGGNIDHFFSASPSQLRPADSVTRISAVLPVTFTARFVALKTSLRLLIV